MSETLTLQRSLIRRDGGTQPRAALHPPTVQNYAEALARGEDLPPVDVFYDGTTYWLADGFHRDDAHDERDLDEIGATIHQGTQRDAILFSVGANAAHGLPRSNEDKRRAVLRLLEDEEWRTWSNRKIADVCRVSHPFVGDIRAELYPDDDGKRKAIRDGKEYTVASGNISRSNAERAAQADDEFEIHPLSAIGQVIEGLKQAKSDAGKDALFMFQIKNWSGLSMDQTKATVDALVEDGRLEVVPGEYKGQNKRYQLALVDHIDPVTAEVTRILQPSDQAASTDQPDGDIRTWLRNQLADGPRHYNLLLRQSRTDGVAVPDLARTIKAMRDEGAIIPDGKFYRLAGDDQPPQATPGDLDDDDKRSIRDALVNTLCDHWLNTVQINRALQAATGKRLDTLYLMHLLDTLTDTGKLLRDENGVELPTWTLNPNPPSDADVVQRQADADFERRLADARRSIANRAPHERICTSWLKRAAPTATAAAANAMLAALVERGELRPIEDYYEPIEPAADVVDATSTDSGQELDEDDTTHEVAAGTAPLTLEEEVILSELRDITEPYLKAWWDGAEVYPTPAHQTLIERDLIKPVTRWAGGSPWCVGFVLTERAGQPADRAYAKQVRRLKRNGVVVGGANQHLEIALEHLAKLDSQEFAQFILASPGRASIAPVLQASLDLLSQLESELTRLLVIARQADQAHASQDGSATLIFPASSDASFEELLRDGADAATLSAAGDHMALQAAQDAVNETPLTPIPARRSLQEPAS